MALSDNILGVVSKFFTDAVRGAFWIGLAGLCLGVAIIAGPALIGAIGAVLFNGVAVGAAAAAMGQAIFTAGTVAVAMTGLFWGVISGAVIGAVGSFIPGFSDLKQMQQAKAAQQTKAKDKPVTNREQTQEMDNPNYNPEFTQAMVAKAQQPQGQSQSQSRA